MLFMYRMFRLVAAGILYLIGISIILTIKPNFMFSEDGAWKEFGIGRNTKTHTWMPFWLFAVLWALVSYILVSIIFMIKGIVDPIQVVSQPAKMSEKPIVTDSGVDVIDEVVEVSPEDLEVQVPKLKKSKLRSKMSDGYYILNKRATELSGGIPKYIYLGRSLPE
jgi:hypothetical protein